MTTTNSRTALLASITSGTLACLQRNVEAGKRRTATRLAAQVRRELEQLVPALEPAAASIRAHVDAERYAAAAVEIPALRAELDAIGATYQG